MNFNHITFDNPVFLTGFAVFIPLFLFNALSGKYKLNLSEELNKKLKLSAFVFHAFIVFSIIAIAGPRWGTQLAVNEFRRGLDVVFAIDVSRSMDVKDAHASSVLSRLERGLIIARETTISVTGIRYAAAVGRGRGYLAVPLTWDNEAALTFLEVLDGSSMTGRSTNLEALVEAAADAFQDSSPAGKVIVLISDGESLSGVLRNALNRCAKENIIVTTVALGSDTGSPLSVGEAEADTNDGDAGVIITRRDAAVMRMAAERTGGIYIDGSRDDAAVILSNHLLSLAQETSAASASAGSRSEPRERRVLFVILAIIAYGVSKLIPLLPFGKILHRLPTAALILFTFTFLSCSEGKLLLVEANYLHSRGRYDEALIPYLKALNFEDAAPYAEYGLGVTFHSLEEGRAALKRFDSSQKKLETLPEVEHRELRYRNNYNSGIVFFEEGDFHSAAAAFRNALRADPKKIDAKRNLELSLLSIAKLASEENRDETRQENETREILFEYIKQQEQQQWRSLEWAPEEQSTGPDY